MTKYGWTAVEIAAINGHYDIIEMLHDGGCDINFENPYNKNHPLESAIEGGHLKTVK